MNPAIDICVGTQTGYTDDGFLGVQIDEYGEEQAGAAASPVLHQYGFASRPKASGSNGVGVHVIHYDCGSGQRFAVLYHDPRVQERIPPLTEGSSVQYGDWGGFAQFDEDTNTWTLYIPDGPTATKAHLVQVGEDTNGVPAILIVHSSGMAITMLDKTMVLKNAAGDAYIELNESGGVLNGNWLITGSLSCGGETAVPVLVGPAPGVPSISLMAAPTV